MLITSSVVSGPIHSLRFHNMVLVWFTRYAFYVLRFAMVWMTMVLVACS